MKIMKKFLLSAAVCLTALEASAQSYLLNNPDNHSYFGLRASYDLSCPGKVKTADLGKTKVFGIGSGVSLGLIYNQPLVANFYIEPGVTFYYNTESIEPEALGKAVKAFKNRSLRKFGVQVPVQFGYHFDFTPDISLAIMTGPVLNVGISNDYYVTTEPIAGHDIHSSGTLYRDDNGMNRVDCAWRFGAGLTFAKNYYVGVTGDIGMCNMIKGTSGAVTMHDNAVHFTLGYNF